MAVDHIIKQSCRFNIKNPQHRKVNDVLVNLDPEICKSKSQFLINAAEYYIDHFGKEAFTEARRDGSPYVTKRELKDIEERTVEAAVTEARNEVIRLLGGGNMKTFASYRKNRRLVRYFFRMKKLCV